MSWLVLADASRDDLMESCRAMCIVFASSRAPFGVSAVRELEAYWARLVFTFGRVRLVRNVPCLLLWPSATSAQRPVILLAECD